MSRELKPCGTNAAYARHLANGEEACDACKKAHSLYEGQRQTGTLRRFQPAPCGTLAAARRHVRNREPVDQACLEAEAAYMRQWRAERKRKAAFDAAFVAALAEVTS